MKTLPGYVAALLALGAQYGGMAAPAQGVELSVSSEGVVINAGTAGKFVLEVPGLMARPDDYNPPAPAVTVNGSAEAVARYSMGGELAIRVSGPEIHYEFSGVPAEAHGFRFRTIIPIQFGHGGGFAFGDNTAGSFPGVQGESYLFKGAATRFCIHDPSGTGFALTTPAGFHELGDNRVYNWPVFAHVFNYVFQEHPGPSSFRFTVEAWSGPNGAGAPKVLVDRFGQLTAKSFPEKVTSEQELIEDLDREQAWLDSLEEPARDTFGGLPGSRERYGLESTGYFHVDTAAGKQVLVTPEGNAFYHLGVCCLKPQEDLTLVRGRESIFEWLPPRNGNFAGAWFSEDPTGVVSFYLANWIRKHSRPFDLETWSGQMVPRLRKWGFNSAGAWSADTAAMQAANFAGTPMLPLETWMAPGLTAMQGIARMYDPFAPGTEEAIEQAFARVVAPQAENRNIIGYFIGNEQLFENLPRIVPAQNGSSPSKLRLVRMLRERYNGEITGFNTAWAVSAPFSGFDGLNDAPLVPTTPEAAADMREFTRLYLETHYSTVARIFRKHAPRHLLLGSRWQPGTASDETLVKIAAKYVDVLSVNYYTYAIEAEFLERIHAWSGGKPLILSEWHYTSTGQGLGGQKEVATQKDRGLSYRNYVENSSVLPYVIGHQWFSFVDQAVTGRWFEGFHGEAANTGLVNVADRPYTEFLEECKRTNDEIYQVMLGQRPPFRLDDARFAPRTGRARKSLSIPRALPELKLDGTTRNWPGRPPETISASELVLGLPDPGFHGAFRLCWDDLYLHLIAEIRDSTPLANTREGGDLWQGDCLELFIGEGTPNDSAPLLPGDRHILLGVAENPVFHLVHSPRQPEGIRVLTTKNLDGGGYTIQAALPWAALGIQPEAGKELRFEIGIDNSDDGTQRTHQWMWNGSERNSHDRQGWGHARLLMN